MYRAFSLSEIVLWLTLFFVLKSNVYLEVEAIQDSSVVNWCSGVYCQHCAKSEFFPCSHVALSNACGDLCGCCESCVRLRDLGESCGSQLAVRSSAYENFEDSTSRVTILATSSCTSGLVCIDFFCQRRNEKIGPFDTTGVKTDGQLFKIEANGFQKSRKITLPSSIATPWSITFITEIVLKLRSHKNEVSNISDQMTSSIDSSTYITDQEPAASNPKILLGPSRHFLNLIIADKEYQLIYGYDALADLQILLDSLDKSLPNSSFKEFEPKIVYEKFKNIFDYISIKNETSDFTKEINQSSKTLESLSNSKNDDGKLSENVLNLNETFLLQILLFPSTLNISESFRYFDKDIRRKREAKDAKESKAFGELEYKSNDQSNGQEKIKVSEQINERTNGEFVAYNFSKEHPETIEDIDRYWLVLRDAEDKLQTDQRTELGDVESAINIHITGVPRLTNTKGDLSLEMAKEKDERDELVDEDYGSYNEELEVFVTEANSEVPTTRSAEKPRNFESLKYENVERDEIDNVTENYWEISTPVTSQFSNNVYDFTFSENPVNLESDSLLRELGIRVNETMDEFRTRLDRIETKVTAIGSSMYEIFSKFRSDEKSGFIREEQSEDPSLSLNKNTVERRATMNIQSHGNSRSEEANQSIGKSAQTRQNKRIRFPKENSTGTSHHRQWRTLLVQPSLESQNKLKFRRRRPNGTKSKEIVRVPQQDFRLNTLTRFLGGSDRKNHSDMRKWITEDATKLSGQISYPTVLSDGNNRNLHKHSLAESPFGQKSQTPLDRLFASEHHFNFDLDYDSLLRRSSASNQRTLWPLNSAWNRALSSERNKRTSTPETPIGESILALETQIPNPVRSGMSKTFDRQLGDRFMNDEISGKYSEESDDWNWDTAPSFNLFVVEGQNSEFGLDGEPSESLVVPVENIRVETSQQDRGVDNSWDHIYPEYLDYSGVVKKYEDKEQPIVEGKPTETTLNHQRSRRIDPEYSSRKKRSFKTVLQGVERHLEVPNDLKDSKMKELHHSNSNESSVNMDNRNSSILSKDSSEKSLGETILQSNLSSKRPKRSVQMVDWLRAAQEYHERLHQVRNAAVKTWLASREELEDTNLTNVKLFTREIPAYLEKYTPGYIVNDEFSVESEESPFFAVLTGDSGQSMSNNDELLGKFVSNEPLQLNDNKKENVKRSPEENTEISSSTLPRKFTIITTGNSTIRVDEMPKNSEDINESLLEDQSGDSSINSELLTTHHLDYTSNEDEDFDHMYESFDAEDGDFDYDDQSYFLSRLLDEVDIIDDSNMEDPESGFKSTSEDWFDDDDDFDDEDDEISELFSRSKRESPFFLFKVKSRPNQEVLIWPSNWKALIGRHLKLNRSRNSALQPKRSYMKISKINPINLPLETSAKRSHVHDAGLSFSNEAIGDKEIERHPIELDSARRHQQIFDRRSRQNRRWNTWK